MSANDVQEGGQHFRGRRKADQGMGQPLKYLCGHCQFSTNDSWAMNHHLCVSHIQPYKESEQMSKANERQEGGTHYRSKDIQPWDAIVSWGLGFLDGNVVKYMARWKEKGGIADLRKARHYLDKLIETQIAE